MQKVNFTIPKKREVLEKISQKKYNNIIVGYIVLMRNCVYWGNNKTRDRVSPTLN